MTASDSVNGATPPGEVTEINRRLREVTRRAADLLPVGVGTAPREHFFEAAPMSVTRYRAETADGTAHPLLLAYSMINRPYLLDLQPERSVVRRLTRAGFEVYLVDWGDPTPADRYLDLGDYVGNLLHRAVLAVCAEHGTDAVHLMGICQGGTLSACYAALHPERVKTLATIAAPIDFQTPGDRLSELVRHVDIDALVALHGNVPGAGLNAVFTALKPFRILDQRYMRLPALSDAPEALTDFLRMERWMYDSPDQPGEAFRTFVRDCYQRNRLIRGELDLGGYRVDLRRITMPVFNAYASEDHLIPPRASQALAEHVGTSDYRAFTLTGGHLGLFVSAAAHRRLYPAYVSWALKNQRRERGLGT